MSVNIAEVKEAGHVTPAKDTSFEPEILAYCCEH
jgi:hypothetical protein